MPGPTPTRYLDKDRTHYLVTKIKTEWIDPLSGRVLTLENAGYITASTQALQYYYQKTETYTKTEVNNLISALKTGSYQKVNTTTYPTLASFLQSTGEEGYMYLYPLNVSDPTQGYYIYIWENNAWMELGTTTIDLSGYVPDTRTINGKRLNANITLVAADISDVYSKTQVDTALGGKVDKVSGKGLSTNDFTNALLTKLNGIAANAQVNVIETVKVKDTSGTTNTLTPDANKAVTIDLSGCVAKVSGKGLSTNDYTTTEKNKLAGIEAGAEVNAIEFVTVNDTDLPINSHTRSAELILKVNGTNIPVASDKKTYNIEVPTSVADLGLVLSPITEQEIDGMFLI